MSLIQSFHACQVRPALFWTLGQHFGREHNFFHAFFFQQRYPAAHSFAVVPPIGAISGARQRTVQRFFFCVRQGKS